MTKNIIAALAIATTLSPFAAFAETGTSTATTSPKSKKDFACVQMALDKREDGIISSWSTYTSAVTASLTARKAALHDAWGKTTSKEREAARNSAWSAYRASMKTAQSNHKMARNSAWDGFNTAAKACKTVVRGESKASDQI